MWEDYAENQGGICIEYDTSKLSDVAKMVFSKVQYVDEVPSYTDRQVFFIENTAFELGLFKGVEFSYEHEWRHQEALWKDDVKDDGYLRHCPSCINSVYIGVNATSKHPLEVQTVRSICERRGLKMHKIDEAFLID